MNFASLPGGGLSLVRILGSASRAIGIVRQITPLINDFKPLVAQVPKLYNRLAKLRENANNFTPTLRANFASIQEKVSNVEPYTKNGPVFFQ